MPNRMLRDWTDSEKVNQLTAQGERFFTRLIMKADDYGCYYADDRLLKANLFPLLEGLRETDISRWKAECLKAGLIALYEANSKRYLLIIEFKQRLRVKKRKFPEPTKMTDTCQTDDGHMTAGCQLEEEGEVEEEVEREGEGEPPPLIPEFLEEGLIYDVESDLLKNQIAFEAICCAAGKKKETGEYALKKFHLWVTGKELYPMSRKALYARFQSWLMDEREGKKTQALTKSGPSAREREEAENRKKLGIDGAN